MLEGWVDVLITTSVELELELVGAIDEDELDRDAVDVALVSAEELLEDIDEDLELLITTIEEVVMELDEMLETLESMMDVLELVVVAIDIELAEAT